MPAAGRCGRRDGARRCGPALGAVAAFPTARRAGSSGTGRRSVAAVLAHGVQVRRGFPDPRAVRDSSRRAGCRHVVGAGVLLIALTATTSAQPATAHPPGPRTEDVALRRGLPGGGVGAMPAACSWRGGDPDRTTSARQPDRAPRPNLLIAGARATAVVVWQRKRAGDKRRRVRLELDEGGIGLSR